MRVRHGDERSWPLGVGLRQSVEEIDDAGLQGVLGADDHESGLLDELLNDVRAVPQVLHRRLDIGADRRTAQGVKIVPEFRRQQAFDGWPYQIHDGMQIARLILDRPLQLLQRRFDGAALSVAQYDHQARTELLAANSTLPICEGATMLPATRMTNRSPKP